MSWFEDLYWEDGGERPPPEPRLFGTSSSSAHRTPSKFTPRSFRTCDHWRQRFELQDGLIVSASAWLDAPQRLLVRDDPGSCPDFGFYLDEVWASSEIVVSPGLQLPAAFLQERPSLMIYPWVDLGVPEDTEQFSKILLWILSEIRNGKSIDVGCLGGHGRTGTTLACLLVLQGLSSKQATKRVWRTYCENAIETKSQMALISSLAQ